MNLHSVILTVVILCSDPILSQDFGANCDQDHYCATNKGLVCSPTTSKCDCSNGTFTDSLRYSMLWDSSISECAGVEESVCIGVGGGRLFVPPSHQGLRALRCQNELTCVQAEGRARGIGRCRNLPKASMHGVACDQNSYCDAGSGLVCGATGRCACGYGPLTDKINFDLEWDDTTASCMGMPGSACVFGGNEKNVECFNGDCIQLSMMPPGVGVCQGEPQTTSPPDDSSTTQATPTTTGSGVGKLAMAGVATILICGVGVKLF